MEQKTPQPPVNDTSFIDIIWEYLRHWKWFILSLAVCLAIGAFVIMTTQRQYKTSLSVLLNEGKGSTGGSSGLSLDELGVLSTITNLDNEIAILSSPDLMTEVVDSLNLRTHYFIESGLRKEEIYTQSPYSAVYDDRGNPFPGNIELSLVKHEDNYQLAGYYYWGEEKVSVSQQIETFPANVVLRDSIGLITLELTGKWMQKNKEYYATIVSPRTATAMLSGGLMITQSSKGGSTLDVNLYVNNIEKGRAVLAELVRQYNALNVRVNNQMAINTAQFINDRLKHIAIELGEAEKEVVDYKQQHQIADLSMEAQQSISQSGASKQQLMNIETQLNVISLVEQFVNNPANELKAIPNLGINDPDLSRIISEYNQTILTSDELLKSTGEENPSRIRVTKDIDNLRNSISNSLRNVEQAYTISKRDLQRLSGMTQSHIRAIPQQEKGLIEKVRQQQIKESLFLFLMQKREEVNISIASYSDKARIVVSPQWRGSLVAPESKKIMLTAGVIGFLLPIIIIYLFNLFNRTIRNRNELEKLSTVSVIGEIGKKEDKESNVVLTKEQQSSTIAEMFRSLRNNLTYILKPNNYQVMLVTSSVEAEGKTFISINLALSFALSGKKVLLIGADIRHPKLPKYLGYEKQKGLVDFLVNDEVDQWKKYTHVSNLNPNLTLMFSGTIPPNPNELLLSDKLEPFFDEIRKSFDLIILDTAPVGLVSDSYLLAPYTDVTLYVTRENVTPKNSIHFINTQKAEEKLKNMYIIYNGADSGNSYYKYGYGKKYGYEKKKKLRIKS